MTVRYALVVLTSLVTAACGMPHDIDGTLDAIETGQVMRVGLTKGAEHISGEDERLIARLVARLERRTGAHAQISRGATEPLLLALEASEIDLVIGSFDAKTPWKARVSFAPPLADRPHGEGSIELKAAARNGENRWISLIELESRSVAKQGGYE